MSNVVVISGSLSHISNTYMIIEYISNLLEDKGFWTNIISIVDFPVDNFIFAKDDSPMFEKAKTIIENSDGVIIAVPIYKSAYIRVLKAFLDLLPQKVLQGKVVLPLVTGGTIAHLSAINYALLPILSELGAEHLLKGVSIVDKKIQKLPTRFLTDAETEQKLDFIVDYFTENVILNHKKSIYCA